jgi:hypothetical protein
MDWLTSYWNVADQSDFVAVTSAYRCTTTDCVCKGSGLCLSAYPYVLSTYRGKLASETLHFPYSADYSSTRHVSLDIFSRELKHYYIDAENSADLVVIPPIESTLGPYLKYFSDVAVRGEDFRMLGIARPNIVSPILHLCGVKFTVTGTGTVSSSRSVAYDTSISFMPMMPSYLVDKVQDWEQMHSIALYPDDDESGIIAMCISPLVTIKETESEMTWDLGVELTGSMVVSLILTRCYNSTGNWTGFYSLTCHVHSICIG